MRLIIQTGTMAGQGIELDRDIIAIGRGTANDLILADPSASRNHCLIRRDVGEWIIEDRGSQNGTFVNGERITAPRALHLGDEVKVGETHMSAQESQAAPTWAAVPPQTAAPIVPPPRQGASIGWILGILGIVVVLVIGGVLVAVYFLLPRPTPTLVVAVNTPQSIPTPAFTPQPSTGRAAISPVTAEQVKQISRSGSGPVNQIAWSQDQHTLALASSYGVYLYNRDTLTQTNYLTTTGFLWSVALSRDGNLIAAGSEDSEVRVWQVSDGKLLWQKEHAAPIKSVAFSPDSGSLASASQNTNDNHFTVRLWRATDGNLIWQKEIPSGARSVAFSPDGKTVVVGFEDGIVRLLQTSDGSISSELRGHTGIVTSVAFSADGSRIASGSEDRTIRVWDLNHPTAPRVLSGHEQSVLTVAFSGDGKFLASGAADHTFRVWQVSDGTLLHDSGKQEQNNWIWSVAFSPDSSQLATAGWDGTVRFWRASDWSSMDARLSGFTHDVQTITFSPSDATLFASGADDSNVRLWRVTNPLTQTNFNSLGILSGHTSFVDGVAFSPDGNWLASASRDSTARIWDVSNPDGASTVPPLNVFKSYDNWVRTVAFGADKNILASGSFQSLRILQSGDGAELQKLRVGTDWTRSIAFSPNPSVPFASSWKGFLPQGADFLVATGNEDGSIRVWDVKAKENVWNLRFDWHAHSKPVRSIAFSPERYLLASASDDGTIRIWGFNNCDSNKCDVKMLQELKGHRDQVTSLAFTPDGSILASGSADKTIRLWRTRDWLTLIELKGHSNSVSSLAFNRDGTLLVSGSSDGTIGLWGVGP